MQPLGSSSESLGPSLYSIHSLNPFTTTFFGQLGLNRNNTAVGLWGCGSKPVRIAGTAKEFITQNILKTKTIRNRISRHRRHRAQISVFAKAQKNVFCSGKRNQDHPISFIVVAFRDLDNKHLK